MQWDADRSFVLSLDERARMRAALAFDIVLFAAACPTCGGEAEWLQQREDTRLRTQITCFTPDCAPAEGQPEVPRQRRA